MKRCSASFVIRERQIQTTCHLHSDDYEIPPKTKLTRVAEDVSALAPLCIADGKVGCIV